MGTIPIWGQIILSWGQEDCPVHGGGVAASLGSTCQHTPLQLL